MGQISTQYIYKKAETLTETAKLMRIIYRISEKKL